MNKMITMTVVLSGLALTAAPVAGQVSIQNYVDAVSQASTGEQAAAYYAAGVAAAPSYVPLHEAYLLRMAELGLADQTISQTQSLLWLDPSNGIAWAVTALRHATEGQLSSAVSAVERALRDEPGHPFVLHTAGQIVAWHDYGSSGMTILVATVDAVSRIRRDFTHVDAFAAGYEIARDDYLAAVAEQQAALAEPVVPAPVKTVLTRYVYPTYLRYVYRRHFAPGVTVRPHSPYDRMRSFLTRRFRGGLARTIVAATTARHYSRPTVTYASSRVSPRRFPSVVRTPIFRSRPVISPPSRDHTRAPIVRTVPSRRPVFVPSPVRRPVLFGGRGGSSRSHGSHSTGRSWSPSGRSAGARPSATTPSRGSSGTGRSGGGRRFGR